MMQLPLATLAGEEPLPPCGEAAHPAFPQAGAPPAVRVWTPRELAPNWQPPACTGWSRSDFQFVIALAGRFESPRTADGLRQGFGAISDLRKVRYWSVTDKRWRNLFSSATALEGPDPRRRRADFTLMDLASGQDVYFAESDNRSSSPVVYRMRARDMDAGRFVVEMENITPVRFYLLTLFPPGALQSVFILQRHTPTEWDYYGLVRTRFGMTLFSQSSESYVNRALALFYHYAGVQTPA